jgi:hypothetical protein
MRTVTYSEASGLGPKTAGGGGGGGGGQVCWGGGGAGEL